MVRDLAFIKAAHQILKHKAQWHFLQMNNLVMYANQWDVPIKIEDNVSQKKHGDMSRLQQLKDIYSDTIEHLSNSFYDVLYNNNWNQKFKALLAYKSPLGNYNVSKSYNLQLSHWINRQRQLKRKDELNAEKTERLETIGFSWNPIEDRWNRMFEALQQYKSNNGDCDVPQSYPPNQKLGHWVGTQRIAKKSDKLSSDKIQKLNHLGFSWTRKPTKPTQESPQLPLFD